MKTNVAETIIGALVLAIAGGFLFYASNLANLGRTGGFYELTAQFRKAEGLSSGGDVRIAGVKVGIIKDFELNPQNFLAKVTFSLRDNIKIPEDSSARIATEGLLGSTYLSIEPGGALDNLAPGDEIEYTQGSVSMMDLIGKAIHTASPETRTP